MKLGNFIDQGMSKVGVVIEDRIIDLSLAAEKYSQINRIQFPTEFFNSVDSILRHQDGLLNLAGDVVNWVVDNGLEEFLIDKAQSEIGLPLPSPGKIVCIGLNYADHCREQGVEEPQNPLLFTKFTTSLIPQNSAIHWPPEITQKVDYEAELAVIIGKKAHNVPESEALNHVAGYTIINDISARDVQFTDVQWIRGKSFDTFCPMGPYVVTADAIANPHDLAIKCRVNGQTLQDSNTREMIFKIPYLISYISKSSTLMPGDVISTGTPHGVGVFRNPQVFLKPGDIVEVEIEKIGILRNPVV